MKFIFKLSLGLYVLSVLAFSSWSRALDVPTANNNDASLFKSLNHNGNSLFGHATSAGLVFEDHGLLFFEDESGELSILHSNSFIFFQTTSLPARVIITGASIVANNFGKIPTIQIDQITFLN